MALRMSKTAVTERARSFFAVASAAPSWMDLFGACRNFFGLSEVVTLVHVFEGVPFSVGSFLPGPLDL